MRSRAGSRLPAQHLALVLTLHEPEDVCLLLVPGSAAIAYNLSVMAPEVKYEGVVPHLAVRATDDEGAVLFGPYPGGAAAAVLAGAPVIRARAVTA